jgi:hypothetical protein
MNRDAKRTTLRQFRQFMQPGFFKDFAAMRARILTAAPVRVLDRSRRAGEGGGGDRRVRRRYLH